MNQRNRSEGWKHAKTTGHVNEALVKDLMLRCGAKGFTPKTPNAAVKNVSIGGLKEKGVNGVLGRKTKSKTELKIDWSDGRKTNCSIKKSLAGQVFLINTVSFITGFRCHFGKKVPDNVINALKLFFGEGDSAASILEKQPIIDKKIRKYEQRKKRLVWTTLQNYNSKYADDLLKWLKNNTREITEFCFSKGLAADPQEWAEYVWYKNLVDGKNDDYILDIVELCSACQRAAQSIKPGTRGGGTTILLPFGFVQWHQGQMQFHHSLKAINQLKDLPRN